MTEKPSIIRCPNCGDRPAAAGPVCVKCGARLEKACGECGFGNPVENTFCDKCKMLLSLAPPQNSGPAETAAPPASGAAPQKDVPHLEIQAIQDTVNEKDASYRRAPHEEPQPAAQPAPQLSDTGTQAAPISVLNPDSSRLMRDAGKPVRQGPVKRFTGPVVTFFLLSVLMSILYMIAAPYIPRMRLLMTAKAYLTDISQGKFEDAYGLLSTNSKSACSLDEYVKNSKEYYAKAPAWQFRDVQVFFIDKDAAMIRYQLKEGGAEWKHDYISFVREHGRWTRPYIWVLFQPIENALNRQDFPQALFLAQKLYLTDPIDPRTSGYLCASEFFMKLYEKSAESCSRTIAAAAEYPVGYTSEELYWFNFYYADSLRYLARYAPAMAEYEKLLKWPGLSIKEQCPLFLNRADSMVKTRNYDGALQDMMKAEEICTQSAIREDIDRHLKYLSGTAGAEAVTFAQKARFQQGMPPIGEARKQQLEKLKTALGPKGAKLLPVDHWLAVHVAGPEYRVFLRQQAFDPQTKRKETQDVYTFLINLWTGKAKVEKVPAAPTPPETPQSSDTAASAPAPAGEEGRR